MKPRRGENSSKDMVQVPRKEFLELVRVKKEFLELGRMIRRFHKDAKKMKAQLQVELAE